MSTVELSKAEAEMTIEAIEEGIFNLERVLQDMHPANPLGIRALEGGVKEWSALKELIRGKIDKL